jgi:hypothetical protein
VPFASFTTTGSFNFGAVNSLLVTLNGVPATTNVDFQLTRIESVPEPSTFALAGLALTGLLVWRRRR